MKIRRNVPVPKVQGQDTIQSGVPPRVLYQNDLGDRSVVFSATVNNPPMGKTPDKPMYLFIN